MQPMKFNQWNSEDFISGDSLPNTNLIHKSKKHLSSVLSEIQTDAQAETFEQYTRTILIM